jgi:glycine cleavage system T protein (aminomethyltransferase)
VLKSPLHNFHVSSGAKMIDFAGWEMPVHYRGIIDEHLHTRSAVSVFDVSHMGRIKITGTEAEAFLDHLCTRKLTGTAVGQSKYTHVCREDGGILDDVIVSHHEEYWYLVCNASNREKIVNWLIKHAAGRDVALHDETLETAMIAIQGPSAIGLMDRVFGLGLEGLKRYWFTDGQFLGMTYSVYRCGYTGEDGAEAIIPVSAVDLILPLLFGDGEGECKPAGLGARDTLRLEAGMPLYGHELHENVDSLTAGQGWCVHLDDKDFIGADAMRKIRDDGIARKLVGLELQGKRIARQGYGLTCEGETVGEVTSGTMSPTLSKSIAMGFIDTAHASPETSVAVDLGRSTADATVVKMPFYKRT